MLHLSPTTAGLLAVALGGTAVGAWRLVRAGRQVEVGLAAAGLAGGAALLTALPDTALPADALVALHEGRGTLALAHLRGHGVHAGQPYREVLAALSGDTPHLRDAVRLHLAAALAGLGVLFGLLRHAPTRGVAVLALAALVIGRPFPNALLSEVPATVVWWATWLAIAGLALHRGDRPDRVGAAALLAASAAVLLGTRPEMTLLPLAVAVSPWVGPPLVATARRLHARALAAPTSTAIAAVALTAALQAAGYAFTGAAQPVGWALHAINPLSPTVIAVPVDLADAGVPVLFVGLATAGAVATLRAPTAAVVVAGVVLARLYLSASHGVAWERFRYGLLLHGLLPLAVLVGAPVVARWASDRGVPRPILAALAALALVARVPGGPGPRWNGPDPRVLGIPQQEVHALVRLTDAHPTCAIVAPTRRDGCRDARCAWDWTWVPPDAPPRPLAPLDGAPPPLPADAPCTLLWHGVDCGLDGARCDAPPGDPVARTVPFPRLYVDPDEYGALRTIPAFTAWWLIPQGALPPSPGPPPGPPPTSR